MDIDFYAVVSNLLKEQNITWRKVSRSFSGRAWVKSREVKMPMPTNIDSFLLCLHEIGHVVCGATKHSMKLYASEYIAERWAIQFAERLGINCTNYKEKARRYVIMCIAKGHCRGLNLTKIPEEVKLFCGTDFSKWHGKKVFIRNWGHRNLKYPLEILMN